jgi:hypothetical protein
LEQKKKALAEKERLERMSEAEKNKKEREAQENSD